MKKELISEAVSNIKAEYITEAQTTPTANRPWQRRLVAAVVALCLLAGGLWALSPSGAMNVTAYAVDSNQPITANGVVLDTGTISDSGEMTHHPLQFCLDGAEMKRVRFSCKNQELDYRDCTEQRDEYGQAQNFVVEYGSNTDEYPYLLIDWVPDKTIRALTDNEDMTIAKLPEELREDVIVLEITYANDQTDTKALTVTLQDNGQFFAKFVNYKITDADTFVKRPDAKVVPRAELYAQGDAA